MLKIKTTNDKLLGPLQQVTGIVERRHTLPILSNVLISAADGNVDFLATDLEVQITSRAALGNGAEGSVTAAWKRSCHARLSWSSSSSSETRTIRYRSRSVRTRCASHSGAWRLSRRSSRASFPTTRR